MGCLVVLVLISSILLGFLFWPCWLLTIALVLLMAKGAATK